MTDAEVVGKIDQLLNTNTFGEIAATLNQGGCVWQLHLAHFGSLIWPTLVVDDLRSGF